MEMLRPLISNIIVAVNGSEASILAAKYAIVMAKNYHCKLVAVYVVDEATIKQLSLSKIFVPEESQEYLKGLTANGERYLTFVDELASAKGIKIEKIIRHGAVLTEILNVAEEKETDLIIFGGWEKTRNARDIFSHPYREIMINAKCSILLVKEPGIDVIYKRA